VGAVVRVHGRPFLLYDCDASTRRWYAETLGYPPEALAPLDVDEPPPPLPRPAVRDALCCVSSVGCVF
jgi:hypothetical protein